MYTQCPDCQTRFRVTADALRTARGTVRCGRCGSAFDALVSLSDTPPRPEPEPAPPLLIAAGDEITPLEVPYVERLAGPSRAAFEEPVEERFVETMASDHAESTIVLVDEGGAGEDITLEGERVQIEGTAAAESEGTEQEFDLDATDKFEVLRIPASQVTESFDWAAMVERLVGPPDPHRVAEVPSRYARLNPRPHWSNR